MATGWRYIIARSSDMEILRILKNPHGRKLSIDLNQSGSASCWIPITEQAAGDIVPWKTCLITQFDNEWFWSGPINRRVTDMQTGHVMISAVGWFERLMYLLLQDRLLQFVNEDAAVIIEALLDKALELWPDCPVTMGSSELSQLRTVSYQLDQNIGSAIQDLVNVESGVDWSIDPVTRQLNIYARQGVPRTNLKWTFIGDGKSRQSNLSNVVETYGDETPINDFRIRGKFASARAYDQDSIDEFGLFMEAPPLSDVVDNDILNAYGNAEIVYRSTPRLTYDLTPKSSTKPHIPQLFSSRPNGFDLGDTGYLTARRGHVDVVDLGVRMFGVDLDITDQGKETITRLQTRIA